MRLRVMVFECDTEFSHYQVEDTYYNGRPARVLYSGNKDAAQSGLAQDDDPELLFDYNQRFAELVDGVRPKRILLLGGGVLTLPTALVQEFPDVHITVAERDRALLDIAEKYFGYQPDDHRIEVHIGDGRKFLDATDETYDMIIMDVFEDDVIPPSFQTAAFVQSMKRHMRKKGIVAINMISSLDGRASGGIRNMQALLQQVFLSVQIFPATRGLTMWTPQNYIVVAQDGTWDIPSFLSRPAVGLSPD